MKRPDREADHSSPFGTEILNVWSSSSSSAWTSLDAQTRRLHCILICVEWGSSVIPTLVKCTRTYRTWSVFLTRSIEISVGLLRLFFTFECCFRRHDELTIYKGISLIYFSSSIDTDWSKVLAKTIFIIALAIIQSETVPLCGQVPPHLAPVINWKNKIRYFVWFSLRSM
jgi:hypothetical protein